MDADHTEVAIVGKTVYLRPIGMALQENCLGIPDFLQDPWDDDKTKRETLAWSVCSLRNFFLLLEAQYDKIHAADSDGEETDFQRFEMMAGHIRTIAETMLTEFFGDRCADYVPSCINCQRWRLLDELTLNPFDEDEEADQPMPREFEPEPRPTGDAEHFVRQALIILRSPTNSDIFVSEKAARQVMDMATRKLNEALAIITAGRVSPVVDPGG